MGGEGKRGGKGKTGKAEMIGGYRTRDEGRGRQEERISRGGWRKGGEVMNRKERKSCDLPFIGIDTMGLNFVYLEKTDLGSGN